MTFADADGGNTPDGSADPAPPHRKVAATAGPSRTGGVRHTVKHTGRERFSRFARRLTHWAGSVVPAAASAVFVVGWLILGVCTDFPEWWQTILTEASAAITLSMVFVIQHTSNRQAHATALKLDELIRATQGAGDHVIGIENGALHEQEALGRPAT